MNATSGTTEQSLGEIYEDAAPKPKLIDAPTGRVVPDRLSEYIVLGEFHAGEYVFRAVRGPSGQIDVEGPESGSLNRDVLVDASELTEWVEANYPG